LSYLRGVVVLRHAPGSPPLLFLKPIAHLVMCENCSTARPAWSHTQTPCGGGCSTRISVSVQHYTFLKKGDGGANTPISRERATPYLGGVSRTGHTTAERGGNNLIGRTTFDLKMAQAKARIWPWLDYCSKFAPFVHLLRSGLQRNFLNNPQVDNP
jgi:hypothetical protein